MSFLSIHSSINTDANVLAEIVRVNHTAEFTVYFPTDTPFQHVLEHIGVALCAGLSYLTISHTDVAACASTTDLQNDVFEFAERVRVIYPK